jgi:hypothetical protein
MAGVGQDLFIFSQSRSGGSPLKYRGGAPLPRRCVVSWSQFPKLVMPLTFSSEFPFLRRNLNEPVATQAVSLAVRFGGKAVPGWTMASRTGLSAGGHNHGK